MSGSNKDKYYMDKYGITEAEKNERIQAQGGKCYLCGEIPKSGILCVDHRHVKNYKNLTAEEKRKEIRKLVCFRCNRYGIGPVERYFKDPRAILHKLIEYFSVFKTKGDL